MAKILLTRRGHVELSLTQVGVTQAMALTARIAAHWKPVAVYTSSLQRRIVTGHHIAEACGVPAVKHCSSTQPQSAY